MANDTYDMVLSGKYDNNIRFSMVMLWSDENQAYIVSVLELPGCMADGRTPTEAVESAKKLYKNGSKQLWKMRNFPISLKLKEINNT